MAQNDNAVLLAAKGHIFVAPVGTAAPTPADVTAFTDGSTLTEWDTLGHTAREDLPVFGFDGGDTEVRGTWQNASLRTVVTEVASDYVTFNVHQFDETALSLYYGVSDPGVDANVFHVNDAPTAPVQRALLIVIVDGNTKVAFHSGKTDIRREDAIELAVDEFAFMPLRATFLKGDGPIFSWISEQTGMNAVTP